MTKSRKIPQSNSKNFLENYIEIKNYLNESIENNIKHRSMLQKLLQVLELEYESNKLLLEAKLYCESLGYESGD
jgi:hypothetical protein